MCVGATQCDEKKINHYYFDSHPSFTHLLARIGRWLQAHLVEPPGGRPGVLGRPSLPLSLSPCVSRVCVCVGLCARVSYPGCECEWGGSYI